MATCYCETVFGLSQLLLSLVLPLALAGYAEARQRRQYAAASQAAERHRYPPRSRRRSAVEAAGWGVSYDGLRLLGLVALIQVCMACVFGGAPACPVWTHRILWPWISGR